MKNKKGKIIFIIIILLIIAGVVGYFMFKKGPNSIAKIFNNNNSKEIAQTEIDSKNGLYVYSEKLNVPEMVFSGCTVYSIDKVIFILDDTYKIYDSTCMGVYQKGIGKTEDLNIKYNEETKKYYILYDDKEFEKDTNTRTFYTHNNVSKNLSKIYANNYKFILKHTQFEGNYYNINSIINGVSKNGNRQLKLNIIPQNEMFTLRLGTENGREFYSLYTTTKSNTDALPNLYVFYDKIIVHERIIENGKYKDVLNSYSPNNKEYDLYNYFPIVLNGETLDLNNSFFIYYDDYEKKFHLLVSENEKLCVYGSDSDDTTYYEFEIEYDYQTKNLSQPNFIGLGKKKDGCNRINKLIGE